MDNKFKVELTITSIVHVNVDADTHESAIKAAVNMVPQLTPVSVSISGGAEIIQSNPT